MVGVLAAVHIIICLARNPNLTLADRGNVFTFIAAVSLFLLLLFSVPLFRRFSYDLFLSAHRALAVTCVYFLWRHLPSRDIVPRIYLHAPLGVLLLSSVSQFVYFLYLNGFLSSRSGRRAVVVTKKGAEPTKAGVPMTIRVKLSRPLAVKAGQYVKLWMPSVSLFAWMQTHPFMVTSWSPGKQDTLELLVQTCRGLTKTLHTRAADDGQASFSAFVVGPHGFSEPVDQYESILAVASGFGIAGIIPYLKQLLHGYNTATSRIRRVHFVWEVDSKDLSVAAQPWLNDLLEDDVLSADEGKSAPESDASEAKHKKGYIIEISPYVTTKSDKQIVDMGKHNRVKLYTGSPDYGKIMSEEFSGDFIRRVTNTEEEKGKLLVLVSASDALRDKLRPIVCQYLSEKVKMHEVDFQPT
ncbi:NADPH oxidase family protein [Aspergillus lucknowensis]|uniref:ferric-chelate reductase (NADPH) n=1 Tax=Aspergillus lucknowensis TaxID=176173 RepID=A0ABR4LNQ7_9EURO